ncbi:wax ester/triacylglycerol synthase domain-containing protein [Ferrimonas aestuarii]|nr:wax ester/triacylglycerol synthase domain-containing protein [Ferrimonas aestuarii]
MTPVSLSELVFLLFESDNNPLHVSCLMVLEPPKDAAEFAGELLEAALKATPVAEPFDLVIDESQFGLPQWRRCEHVDLAQHVRIAKLPTPGDRQQLRELAGRIHSARLERDRPLWEMWILYGLESQEIGLLVKFHHALADGKGVASMLEQSFRLSDSRKRFIPFWQLGQSIGHRDSSIISLSKLTSPRFWYQQLDLSVGASKLFAKACASRLHLLKSPIKLPFSAPRTPFNSYQGSRAKKISLATLPKARIRKLSMLTGVGELELMLTLCDMALHQYLQQHNWQDRDPLVAMVPLYHPQSGERMHMISVGLVELGRPAASPMQRLKKISQTYGKLRTQSSDEQVMEYNRYSALVNIVSLLAARYDSQQILPPAANMLMSQVDAGTEPLSLMGAKLKQTFPLSLLLPGQTLNMTLLDYHEQVHIGLVCCRQSLPGFDSFALYLPECLEQLEKSAYDSLLSAIAG